jgi:hypothetical protein
MVIISEESVVYDKMRKEYTSEHENDNDCYVGTLELVVFLDTECHIGDDESDAE